MYVAGLIYTPESPERWTTCQQLVLRAPGLRPCGFLWLCGDGWTPAGSASARSVPRWVSPISPGFAFPLEESSLNVFWVVVGWKETRDRPPRHYVCVPWCIRSCKLQLNLSLEHLFHGSSLLGGPRPSLHVFLSNPATWFFRAGRSCIPGAAMSWSGTGDGPEVRKRCSHTCAHTQLELLSFILLRNQDEEAWGKGLKIWQARAQWWLW